MNLWTLSLRKNNWLLVLLVLAACKSGTPRQLSLNLNQGLKGKVVFKEGSFLPTGEINEEGKIYLVKREILVYKLTNLKEIQLAGNGFIKYMDKSEVIRDFSDEKGEFKIFLEPGTYSILIKENERLYSKFPEDENHIFPIEVKNDLFTDVVIEIDYKANY